MFTQTEMRDKFVQAANDEPDLVRLYQKCGSMDIRLALPNEVVQTIIDGVEETTKTAGENDVVVRGPKGECYIIDNAKFTSRYKQDKQVTHEFQTFEASGFVDAYEYRGPSFEFIASWGTPMICNDGDFLANPANAPGTIVYMTERWPKEVYRIEREVFFQTYSLVDCQIPPEGWYCTRGMGHRGPCAALPKEEAQ